MLWRNTILFKLCNFIAEAEVQRYSAAAQLSELHAESAARQLATAAEIFDVAAPPDDMQETIRFLILKLILESS